MSRAAANKGRNDKGKTTAAPTPAITHDIVPGKFNDEDWNLMLDHDDGEDFILDLAQEVCTSATDIIYAKYLERQLIPYIVTQAKDALIQIVEWQFLLKDKGETAIESSPEWTEDEEPAAAITDCWAQGSVPRRVVTPVMSRPPTVMEEPDEEPVEQTNSEEPATGDALGELDEPPPEEPVQEEQTQEETQSSTENTEAQKENTQLSSESPKENMKKRKKFRSYKGKLGSAHLGKMTESLDNTEMQMLWNELSYLDSQSPDPESLRMPNSCNSLLKLQGGRPPGQRDITYDASTGSVISMVKINPATLPSHRVKTSFKVVDPAVEAAQARLEAMRTGKHIVPKPPKTQPTAWSSKLRHSPNLQPTPPDTIAPLPPPLLEIIELAPGVTIKEGDRVKKGPKQYSKRTELLASGTSYSLRPVTMKSGNNTVTVQELIDRQSPTVRPFTDSPPIPPIKPHPPSQAV